MQGAPTEEKEIVPLYDYVHLQKRVRNNLLTKDLLINKNDRSNKQYGCWEDIITAYNMDRYSFFTQATSKINR